MNTMTQAPSKINSARSAGLLGRLEWETNKRMGIDEPFL